MTPTLGLRGRRIVPYTSTDEGGAVAGQGAPNFWRRESVVDGELVIFFYFGATSRFEGGFSP